MSQGTLQRKDIFPPAAKHICDPGSQKRERRLRYNTTGLLHSAAGNDDTMFAPQVIFQVLKI